MSDVTEFGPSAGVKKVRVLIVEDDAIVKVPLFYAREVNPTPQVQTIPFEGDDTSQTEDDISRWDIEVTLSKQDLASVARIFGKTRVTTPAEGMEWGTWWGDSNEVGGVLAGLEYDSRFKDEAVSPYENGTLRTMFPKGTLKARRLSGAQYQQANTMVLNFSFEKTTTDLLGDTLSGVPSDGAYFLQGLVAD